MAQSPLLANTSYRAEEVTPDQRALLAAHSSGLIHFRFMPLIEEEDAKKSALPPAVPHPASGIRITAEVSVSALSSEASASGSTVTLITARDIETSAGTFGDPSRFLQTLAGVVSDNDQRNDFLVRGGNPDENAFLIDNIEIPSINHLALSDTTGGFVSMIDENAVQQIEVNRDAYDSKFEQRLSSVIAISTRPVEPVSQHSIYEFGIAGAGGSMTRPLGEHGSFLVSVRQSVLQYFTKDIGLNGVPHYRNFLARADLRTSERDTWWGISLTGIDSLLMNPDVADPQETSPFVTSYKGWRSTTGINWQHVFSNQAFGVMSIAESDQVQTISQQGQMLLGQTVYSEDSRDHLTTGKYDFEAQLNPKLTLTLGGRMGLDRLQYAVEQPIGLQNPYSADPAPENAAGFQRKFATGSGSLYAQLVVNLPHHASLSLGERGMDWALLGHARRSDKVLFELPFFGHVFHLGFADYFQLPPTLYLLSFKNIETLRPIVSKQITTGIVLNDSRRFKAELAAYRKTYSDYPVATLYPQLSMATIADTFGQAFLLFPMTAKGTGLAQGVELSASARPSGALNVSLSAAYSRSRYAGLDGVLRRSNYDLPFTMNVNAVWKRKHGFTWTARESYASGKPYTPDNFPLSFAQDRDVYDLTRINAIRAPFYNRIDLRVEQQRAVGKGILTWHVGLENLLSRANFYSLNWQPQTNWGQIEQDQMPLFPDGGLRYSF
jgi:hypothetical protein